MNRFLFIKCCLFFFFCRSLNCFYRHLTKVRTDTATIAASKMEHSIMRKRHFNETSTLSEDSSSSSGDDDDSAFAAPQIKRQYENYSDKSLRMMEKMGYKSDTGLGKAGQGRLDPIEASSQKGRRGFGLKLDGIDSAAQKWTPEMENIQLRETAEWVEDDSDDLEILSSDELKSWAIEGCRKLTIDDETLFCDPQVLENVLRQKTVFDKLGADDMRKARTRSNPFETIRGAFFLNRAAVKMANMDALFDFMFTEPVDEHGASLVHENDLLYFADVCAGPGGFSEYVLWKKKWQAKGFGFTLQCENDFKLHEFFAGPPETFDAYYGCKGDGNVYDPENIESLADYVLKQTVGGVHFMMSDGGFSVEGQENVQEILSKQLYLCQCLVALSIVRVNGHFVTKVFDLFTPFSVGLIYLMYKCFKQICIVKPNTSRPANSERYLVCKWKKSNTDTIRNHLFEINQIMFDNCNSALDIMELVPYPILRSDEKFFNYIFESNNTIGNNQTIGLMKIAAYCKDDTLIETRQSEFKTESLRIWKLPNQMRKAPTKVPTDNLFQTLMDKWFVQRDFLFSNERLLTLDTKLQELFYDKTDWFFVPLDVVENTGKSIRTFFMSRGNRDVYKYENKTWSPLTEVFVEMSPNTFVYGEISKELKGEGGSQTLVYALHIIDGMVLGGMDIRNLPLQKRNRLCRKFAAALNKPRKTIAGIDGQNQCIAPIRCKPLNSMMDLRRFFGSLNSYKLKDGKIRLGLSVRDIMDPDRFYVPRGIMFFRAMKPNLRKKFDPKVQQTIYIDMAANNKTFLLENLPDPDLIYGSFKATFVDRRLWRWEDPRQVDEYLNGEQRSDKYLYRVDFERFIYGN